MGKGDKDRTVDLDAYRSNYDDIRWPSKMNNRRDTDCECICNGERLISVCEDCPEHGRLDEVAH